MVKVWHAVYTRSRAEKKVVEKLVQMGFTCYLPMIKTIREWSDRKKKVEMPLISSYVFVLLAENEQLNVLNTTGVVSFVRDKGKPAQIPEQQINIMRSAVDGNMSIEVVDKNIEPGQRVKVVQGPLSGYQGELIKSSNQSKFIIRLDELNFIFSIELNASDIEKV